MLEEDEKQYYLDKIKEFFDDSHLTEEARYMQDIKIKIIIQEIYDQGHREGTSADYYDL